MPQNVLLCFQTGHGDERLFDFGASHWQADHSVALDRLWNGELPTGRANRTRVCSFWNSEAVFFFFACTYDSLNISEELGEGGPLDRLWEYDVVEVFLRPRGCRSYFEIEVSPKNQWLDLHILKPRSEIDKDWHSQLRVEVRLRPETKRWQTALKLPFQPLLDACGSADAPQAGEVWRVNLFRAAGKPPIRDYFAWRPTFTEEPDFHVPSAFGNLIFFTEAMS